MRAASTVAVIVAYHPPWQSLMPFLHALLAGGVGVVVVDNSLPDETTPSLPPLPEGVVYQALGQNLGLGEAANRGAAIAREVWPTGQALWFFDQDSQLNAEEVSRFLEEATAFHASSPDACLAPLAVHADKGTPYLRRGRSRAFCQGRLWVREAMHSGLWVPLALWARVGGFRADLFIDWVDFEWCWRAGRQGIRFALTDRVVLRHRIGQGEIDWLGGLKIPAPIRHYYLTRNFFLLQGEGLMAPYDRLKFLLLLLPKVLVFAWVPPGAQRLRYLWQGLRDGLRGRGGPWRAS